MGLGAVSPEAGRVLCGLSYGTLPGPRPAARRAEDGSFSLESECSRVPSRGRSCGRAVQAMMVRWRYSSRFLEECTECTVLLYADVEATSA